MYRVNYIEQDDQNKGLRKQLVETTDPAAVQSALDSESASNGDKDRTHYEVLDINQVIVPEAKSGGVVFRV